MKDPPSSIPWERYLAVDLHKHYLVIGGVNAHQEIVLGPRRMDLTAWPRWAQSHLLPTDSLVVEATTNAWDFYDHTQPLVGRLQVANAGKIALIAKTRVKTDALDVLKLARLSAANLIPEVWVPPQEVRELRNLIAHRWRLTRMHTMTANRLQSLLHRYHFVPPAGELFWDSHRAWWDGLVVSPTERLRLRQDLATLDHLRPQLAEVDQELARLSTEPPWASAVPLLMQLPGFGLLTVMTVLGALGTIMRLPMSLATGQGGRCVTQPSSWWATRAWARVSMIVGKHTVGGALPSRAAKTCGTSWSKPRGPRSNVIPTGNASLSN